MTELRPTEDGAHAVGYGARLLLGGAARLLASISESRGIGVWWRFALAALASMPLSAWILLARSRSDL